MNKPFYLQLLHTKFNTWELRYSSEGEIYTLLFPITKEQASEMHDDGWPITEEK